MEVSLVLGKVQQGRREVLRQHSRQKSPMSLRKGLPSVPAMPHHGRGAAHGNGASAWTRMDSERGVAAGALDQMCSQLEALSHNCYVGLGPRCFMSKSRAGCCLAHM